MIVSVIWIGPIKLHYAGRMPVTSAFIDANDAPWGAAPILNLNLN